MIRFFIYVFLVLTSTLNSNLNAQTTEDVDVLTVTPSLAHSVWEEGQGGDLILSLNLVEGYHAYAERFQIKILKPIGFTSGNLRISPLKEWYDKPTKKNRKGIEGHGTIKVYIEAPRRFSQISSELIFELTYQACSETVCFLPFTKTIQTPIVLKTDQPLIENPSLLEAKAPSAFLSLENFEYLINKSLLLSLVFVFLAGVLTSFTPCIFPMIPITLAVLGRDAEKHKRLQNFFISLFYVFGIAMTYSMLGVLFSMTGGVFGSLLGSPILLTIMCFIFLAMSLSMFGLFEVQLPLRLQNHLTQKATKKGYVGAFFSGLLAGVVASPCVGPVLIGILTYVSSQKNPFLGFILLFTYALGLGLIFILLGLFNQVLKYLPRSGPWMLFSKFLLGSLMLSAFYYYFQLLVPQRVFDMALGIGLVVIASVYGAFLNTESSHITDKWRPYMRIRKGKMIVLLFVGIGFIMAAVFDYPFSLTQSKFSNAETQTVLKSDSTLHWSAYTEVAFNEAILKNRPILLDIRADWCGACLELEEKTFKDPKVVEILKNYTLFKFDATRNSPELEKLTQTYDIKGLPMILFFDPQGVWIKNKTLMQYEGPEKFLKRVSRPN
jgi:thiol:disulfide interchange protein DsbD